MDDLKPCPFCGSPAYMFSGEGRDYDLFAIRCDGDSGHKACSIYPKTGLYLPEAEAITSWNTRAPDPRLAEVTAERDGLRDHLAWYADTFCEQGPYSEVCGRLGPDECAGCRARAALGAKP